MALQSLIGFQSGFTQPQTIENMAERVGFEPTIPVKVCPLSRRIVSTTHAPLRTAVVSGQLPEKAIR
jgi:hypothetical protein